MIRRARTVPRGAGPGQLDDLGAGPVLLRDSVIEPAGPRYRTNDELLNLDPRLD
ncbi:hypothetical protein OG372_18155 [Streptomyces sp. NBC_01020]|uniref:hypothetical protein n=1 Tax=Streptomyces sp. NBC_01020 TaxID=2903722 RepID=UPI00386B8006|nr:hypothetical protein OG372_18155 [Streptomyces sp. NBC_01020]